MVGRAVVEHLGWIHRLKRRLGEESPGEEGLKSRLQTAAFPFAVAGWGKDQWFLPVRVRLPATEFLPAVAKREVGQRLSRVALSDAAAGFERHSSAPSMGPVELVWLCHWLRQYGHGAAA